ncbi:hypothetical protein POSPLADRAFT_1065946 [Postia placenta MAD-698-R-SB12]|uniref:Anaphase-promoting complex subunit 4 WD40 domain-containing protein n=1 Tax=Postia placenta MAD-698-R-SB12 TaxID=670580 RepID=A0A1X6N393_9APHY|nr:hypothetical protein POSPLADRAFT_1065946 [Postia placenta MAD-698-R-SB12]OSX62913.1 hypothetical protein POSPLADRAFT_1065946 [Postia placenta MAD-698-R-SB12]
MDFTEIYKQSASLVCFSPGTRFLLTAIQDRLVIRHAETFQIIRTWAMENTGTPTSLVVSNTAAAKINTKGADPSKGRRINRSGGNEGSASGNESWVTHAGWSCDSEYVFGACAKSGFVEVFQMRDDAWRTRIDAGAEGLTKVEWAPDGRSIVCWSEWGPPPELAVGSRASTSADHITWNADGSLLLVRYGSAPDAVWLYSFPQLGEGAASATRRRLEGPPPKPKLRTVLVHASPVASARWNPVRRGSLAICCGGGALYMWSDEWVSEDRADDHAHALADSRPEGEEVAECVGVPASRSSTHYRPWTERF